MIMSTKLRKDAHFIIEETLKEINPHKAVGDALKGFSKSAYIFAIGKASWTMANAAYEALGARALGGVVITKYDHSLGAIGDLRIFEAGHPLLDENGVAASEYAIDYFGALSESDNIIFLISGGGRDNLQKIVRAWLPDTSKIPSNIKIKIDVNPQNFM